MNNNKSRILYADLLRIIATFSVIILHVSASYWYDTPVYEYKWQVFNFYDAITRWSVPIFVMLSGMFFLAPDKELNIRVLYKKYILRMILALFFWGLFYQYTDIFIKVFIHHESFDYKILLLSFDNIIFNTPWYHLWYLYTQIGLYMLTPLYRVFTKNANENEYAYLIIIFFLFGLCLPFLKSFLPIFGFSKIVNFSLSETMNYSGYFFLGYYLAKHQFSKKNQIIVYFLGLVSMIITVVGNSHLSMKYNGPTVFFYNYLWPTTLMTAVSIFLLLKNSIPSKINEKIKGVISTVSKCSFGIYLIHDFIRRIVYRLGLTAISFDPLFCIPIVSLVIFTISFFLIYLCRKVTIFKHIT